MAMQKIKKYPTVFSSLLMEFAVPTGKCTCLHLKHRSQQAVLSQNAKSCREMAGYEHSFTAANAAP